MLIKKNNFLKCYVISNKMNKTLVVSITKIVKHNIYKKYLKKNIKMYVHDEKNICKIGDYIEIKECRPLSKKKTWIFSKIINSYNKR